MNEESGLLAQLTAAMFKSQADLWSSEEWEIWLQHAKKGAETRKLRHRCW